MLLQSAHPELELAATSGAPFAFDDASVRVALKEWFAESADGRASPRARARYGPMEDWRVGGVRDFSELFQYRREFSLDLGRWDVSGGRTMRYMFEGCA